MEKKKFWGAHMPILGGGGGGGAPSVRSALFFIPPFFRYSPCICEVRDLPTSVPTSTERAKPMWHRKLTHLTTEHASCFLANPALSPPRVGLPKPT